MLRDCQKRAKRNYEKRNVVHVTFHLYPKDADIVQHLRSIPDGSKQEYIRELIRQDMANRHHTTK